MQMTFFPARKTGDSMMNWYVLQTKTGEEEKLVRMIQKILPRALYGECFVLYYEQLWRRHERAFVHVERSFPGYVFITTDEPDTLYLMLKEIPAMSKLMADDTFYFLTVDPAEAAFLARIMNRSHVISLSYLATDGRGRIRQATGPLKACLTQVVRYNFRRRSAAIRLHLAGCEKQIRLGFILPEDIRRQMHYGKVEAPITVPEIYQIQQIQPAAEAAGKEGLTAPGTDYGILFRPGDQVTVTSGDLAGLIGIVCRIRKNTVRLNIHFLGQKLDIEMPSRDVQKLE